MEKNILLEKIFLEKKPDNILLFSENSIETIRIICEVINKIKLTNFQYFHTKVKLFVAESFGEGQAIEDYKITREKWDKVLDMFLMDLDSSISINLINELSENKINLIFNDSKNLNKDILNNLHYENFLEISDLESFSIISTPFVENEDEGIKIESGDIKKEYNTDKFSHGYISFYEKHFETIKNVKNVLEIGVSEGSLNYLKDRFPHANIHGVDIVDKTNLNSERIKTYICNQENREDLYNFIESCNVEFDVIIDDGGHTMKQQQTSLGVLFNKVSDGGLYIIENIHTSRLENLGTITNEDIITTLDMLFNFNYTKKIVSNHITDDEKNYINNNIKSINIWSENSEYNLGATSIIQKNGNFESEIFGNKIEKITKSFDIGITTFSLRFDFIEKLLNKIKDLTIKNRIILCINGEKDGDFNLEYRKKILNLCLNHENVYPIFYIETRGLSKLWNTLIVNSVSENILIMNDDVELETDDVFNSVFNHINSSEYYGLTKINGTFSYFVCSKKFIDSLGYFDERLLGFGEEDGDITHRIIQIHNKEVQNISSNGIRNIVSDIRHDYIKPGIGKYSLFNREFMFSQKYENREDGIRGMFDYPCVRILDNLNCYPYENFFMENKNKL